MMFHKVVFQLYSKELVIENICKIIKECKMTPFLMITCRMCLYPGGDINKRIPTKDFLPKHLIYNTHLQNIFRFCVTN